MSNQIKASPVQFHLPFDSLSTGKEQGELYQNKKRCTKCKRLLLLGCFFKNKSTKDGISCWCKECNKQHRQKNKEKNKEKITKYQKQYYQNNKEIFSKKSKQYNQSNKKRNSERSKQYYLDNKKKITESVKKYYQNNKEKIAIYEEKRRKKNKVRMRGYHRDYQRRKLKEDPTYRLNARMRKSISRSLRNKNISKSGRPWESLVKFTLRELIIHIESLFSDGMTLENYGKWHIDHIKPKSLFNFESIDDSEFKECWALSNLQPLWAKDNLKKSNKYNEHHEGGGKKASPSKTVCLT